MARKKAFTPAAIDGPLCAPISDPETPGLSIRPLPNGCKTWQYRRRLPGSDVVIKLKLGPYPAHCIAVAREWARGLNRQVEIGVDPRQVQREAGRRAAMTVARAHELYMVAVREGRSSRAKRPNKPRTIREKLEIFRRDIEPELGAKNIYQVSEADLVRLVLDKGRTARIRANRLGAELKVFFGWAASLRGTEVGLEADPARRLADLKFPETARSRKLSLEEIEWFLVALAEEKRDYRRGMLLWLLTAARLSEVIEGRSREVADGVWTIPASRVKNSAEHVIGLGPWARALVQSETDWFFPAPKADGPRSKNCWHVAVRRVRKRMEAIAGRPVERFTPHDFRRTGRSNTKRLKIDFETAEAMLNHVKKGLERTYDRYELEEEKRASFLAWEREVAAIARKAGVAEKLFMPVDDRNDPGQAAPQSVTRNMPAAPEVHRLPPWQSALSPRSRDRLGLGREHQGARSPTERRLGRSPVSRPSPGGGADLK
jgi:integrase